MQNILITNLLTNLSIYLSFYHSIYLSISTCQLGSEADGEPGFEPLPRRQPSASLDQQPDKTEQFLLDH